MTRSSLLCVVLCTLLAFSHATDLARRLKSAARHTSHRRRVSAASQSKVFEGMNASQNAKLNLLRQASEAGLLSTSQAWALAERVAFEGFEHAVGSGFQVTNPATQIQFKWIAGDGTIVDKSTNQDVLESKDGVHFSFAMMTASAGDYWSVKDAVANVICAQNVGGTGSQQSRFHTAFNDMWQNTKFGRSAPKPSWLKRDKYKEMEAGTLMTTLQEQLKAEFLKERAGVFPTGLPHDFTDATPLVASAPHRGSQHYEKSPMGAGQVVKDIFNSDTAAGYFGVGGMALADGNLNALPYNDDHFSACAMNTYAFGHNEAVDDAYAAGKKWAAAAPNARAAIAADLNAAYAKEGFVSHFLSDSFSAGHMRTPRLEIRTICTALTGKGRDITQGLTANVMHDEDNWNCLLVQNAGAELWWACGDHRFFDDENAQNRRHLRDTIEATVHQVSDAFIAGTLNQPNPRTVGGWVAAGVAGAGHTPAVGNRYSLENTCPMFRLNNGAWEARTDATITTTPRPAQAMTAAKYGSSIRESMSAALFPAKSTAVKVKLDNDPIPGVHQALDCAYHAMTNSDCCSGSMSRATPLFAADTTPGVDVKANPNAKGPLTADPTNKAKRVTFVNACDATQKLVAAGKAVKSGAVAVAETAYDGLVAYGNAVAMMNGMPILHH